MKIWKQTLIIGAVTLVIALGCSPAEPETATTPPASTNATDAKPVAEMTPAVANASHICTTCKIGSDKEGDCPLCGKAFKHSGAYVCPT